MLRTGKALAIVLAASLFAGCRYKGWESFTSATTANPHRPTPAGHLFAGDPYAYGGIGGANGGLKPTTNYGIGSDPNSTAPVNASFDQPEKGSGQQPGELPNAAVPGSGQENGPALQPPPGSVAPEGAIAHG